MSFIPFSTQVTAQVAGIVQLNFVIFLNVILADTVIRINAVYAVHPAGAGAAIELIEIAQGLDLGAVVHGNHTEGHVNLVLLGNLLQQREDCLSFRNGNGSSG